MKVIPPIAITDALLAGRSSVAEPDATAAGDGVGTTTWASGTTYAAGARVIRASTHRVYESTAGGNVGFIPEDNLSQTPPKWLDKGPTNRWKMLRSDANHRTSGVSPLAVTISPGVRVNAVAIVGMGADSVTVEQRDAGGSVTYAKTQNLRLRRSTRWYEYFFEPFRFQKALLLLDVPPNSGGTITVTLTRATGNVICGSMVVGSAVDLGPANLGATADVQDFSGVNRDFAGNATLIPRKSVPVVSVTTTIPADRVDAVKDALDLLPATVAMWAGIEDSGDPYFNSLAVLGFINRRSISPVRNEVATLTLTIEGL